MLHPTGHATPLAGAPVAGAAPASSASAAPTPTRPPATSGALFDAFAYTGTDDPALKAHGWQVRTALGGPGIHDTWTGDGVSFPTVTSAQGGHALQLQVHTDGTKAGTRQSELESSQPVFFTGTYAARIYFTDAPATGPGGDHINESFYTISPSTTVSPYSELDYEYMPDGGWGSTRPELDTTSWHSSRDRDRVYHPQYTRLHGWHTLTITALHGQTTYALDGTKLFTNDAAHSPRGPMNVEFSTWLIDLPFTGARTWNMQINWFYYQAGKIQTLNQIQKTVDHYYANGTNYLNTLTG
ncbi:glycoside hydrolase family 16 protein [Streptacidiphilus sp. MAP12-20]|uniref:glycoside hydrolase family 16 protein n=1 Tax=Streptacidiphilus sp. MAP12-20 TaxID=3156299 RepID=UPI0035192BCE